MAKEELCSESLISEIHAVVPPGSEYCKGTSAKLALLQEISDKIRSAIPHLPRAELVEVSEKFSAAFKPLRVKPAWAADTCRIIDRTVMGWYNEVAYRDPITEIPFTEFAPSGGLSLSPTNIL